MPVTVVVVDDSAFMRKSLSMMLESDPQIKVVATARDGAEGVEKVRQFDPDVVTMDVEMPGMDGLTALSIIMKEMPRPVLMISSLTSEGAAATLEALNRGAVDFIPKEMSFVSIDIVKIKEDLLSKIKAIAQSNAIRKRLQRLRSIGQKTVPAPPPPARKAIMPGRDYRGVVLGISTGGPFALMQIIPKIPADYPLGIAVVQHMPPKFTKSMSERLNGMSHVEVREAEDGDTLQPGTVLIAPGGRHLVFERSSRSIPTARIMDEPRNVLYKPCVDIMIQSAVRSFNGPLIGVIMTGMGKDGLEGLRDVRKAGGYIIAQNEATCVVYGMPRAVVDAQLADAVVPLDEIPLVLQQAAQRNAA